MSPTSYPAVDQSMCASARLFNRHLSGGSVLIKRKELQSWLWYFKQVRFSGSVSGNLPRILSIQPLSVQSGLGRLGMRFTLLCRSKLPVEPCQCNFTQWVGMCVLHISRGFSSLPMKGFSILNPLKAPNEVIMVNSTGEKVNNDSHGSQRLCFAHRNIPGAD